MGPETFIAEPSRLLPLIVKEFVGDVVLVQTFPKLGNAVFKVTVPPAIGLIVKFCVLEGIAAPVVVTPTIAVPAVEKSLDGIAAVSEVLLTKVVILFKPFQVTVDRLVIKFVPVTFRVIFGLPTLAFVGEMEDIVGLLICPVNLMSSILIDKVPLFTNLIFNPFI